ncbi:hypothetical protein [Pseudomonas citronellolis]|uniref:hypothetical protein n=1 Tax=Pseudomonas citronellolis TaxID=53408 RepID=UPI0012FD8626|nr:hypothetical protein [Pseudomonas citronellolis]
MKWQIAIIGAAMLVINTAQSETTSEEKKAAALQRLLTITTLSQTDSRVSRWEDERCKAARAQFDDFYGKPTTAEMDEIYKACFNR